MPEPTAIAANLKNLRARISNAALQAGRDPAAITLIAVSKTYGPEAVTVAIAAGCHVFGENRVQEATAKFPRPGAHLHLIGPLQTNKAALAVRLAQNIDVLDRPKLADAIAAAADAAGTLPNLLVQVNIGDEPQKAGIPTEQADAFIGAMKTRFGAALRGLMCIPPADADPAPFFRRLAQLADDHALPVRSMGMSGDFEIAIACGATEIRVGSAIFGNRLNLSN
jgi:pyridoxal phosphate enzyme (YggS family)